jgi:hypothetical protein
MELGSRARNSSRLNRKTVRPFAFARNVKRGILYVGNPNPNPNPKEP